MGPLAVGRCRLMGLGEREVYASTMCLETDLDLVMLELAGEMLIFTVKELASFAHPHRALASARPSQFSTYVFAL